MSIAAYAPHSVKPASSGQQGGVVRTFGRKPHNPEPPEIPEETRRMFEAISDPKNAHVFSVEALRDALAHIKV